MPRVHWQDIQKNTFTRWVNEYLGKRGMHVDSLEKDLTDGLALINLMEIISGKKVGRYNKHPKVTMQKMENLGIALKFIKSEGIKLVNIGPEDLGSGNIRCILGLIWTLILRYEINCGSEEGMGDLLQWVRSKIPEYDIKNFQKDWNDGRAVCALIDALVPGLYPDHQIMDPKKKKKNCRTGIELADLRMGIQPLIAPEEMAHPKVPKDAMMTYIAQYRRFAPDDFKNQNDAMRCNAYGPGLQEGVVDNVGHFRVDFPSDVNTPLEVRVEGPTNDAKVNIMKNSDGCYDVSYCPDVPGEYKIHVTVGGDHVPGSCFYVTVLDDISLGGEGKIRVYFSTTSSSQKTRSDTFGLRTMLEQKKVHLRSDFEPWIPIDVTMTPEDRKLLFKKAKTKVLPIVFIDDKYVGDYDALMELAEDGKLDALLNMKMTSLVTEEEHLARLKGEFSIDSKSSSSDRAAAPARKKAPRYGGITAAPKPAAPKPAASKSKVRFCPECGTKAAGGKFCAQCGNRL